MQTATRGVVAIAHRGASGYRPEHTLAAYDLAVDLGADYIEPDLVMTSDGVLVDRHEPDISATTDVAEREEFADRRATRWIDGESVTGWFVDDFTLAELKTLHAEERLPGVRPASSAWNGKFEVPTFEEVLRRREELSVATGRRIGVIPEIKHSTYLHEQGFDPEAELTRLADAYHLNQPDAPLWVQSFELTALRDLREVHGFRACTSFLTEATGGPHDLREEGATYAGLTTREGMLTLSRWVDGLAPSKMQIIPWTADGRLGQPTSFVPDAHAAGLTVAPWTFRAENAFLPPQLRVGSDPAGFGRAVEEVLAFMEAGVDGVFCDHPDICVLAREEFRGRGRP